MTSSKRRAQVFAALGDELRLEIVEELVWSDRTPGELIEKFKIRSALLAHHLDVLELAGLIERTESHADGRKRFVKLTRNNNDLLSTANKINQVVFVCRQNSARSQIAAAIWRSVTGESVASAGTEPALNLHPLTIKIAEHHRLDLSNARPRDLESLKIKGKTIITVCDQSHDDIANPLSRLHWSMPDPAELGTMAAFEKTFQELVERIQPLVK